MDKFSRAPTNMTTSSSEASSLQGKSDEENDLNSKSLINDSQSSINDINHHIANLNVSRTEVKQIESFNLPPLSTWKIENSNSKPFTQNQSNISPALYQYDYNIKSAKFSNFNQNSNLFATQNTSKNVPQQPPPPPPISSRPEKTKSIFTKPVEDSQEEAADFSSYIEPIETSNQSIATNQTSSNGVQMKKKKMTDEEVMSKLRQIVSYGDPNRKYTKIERIGQGYVNLNLIIYLSFIKVKFFFSKIIKNNFTLGSSINLFLCFTIQS